MTFYDRKEEVIQITLTKFGRQLYSKGKLKPFYYAFYDDDILYSADHGGISEEPSSAAPRIKQSTRLRPLSSRVGAERKLKLKVSSKQVSDDKRGLLSNRIGKSDPLTDHNPSWNVKVSRGEISSNARTSQVAWKVSSGIKNTIESENIPQINLASLNCKIKKIDTPDMMAKMNGIILQDGTAITVDMSSGELLLDVFEENSPESFENFDFEIFEIEEVEDSKLQGASTDKHYREVLRPMFFEKRGKDSIDDILIGDGRGTVPQPSDNPLYVSYFLNIESDGEIPKNIFNDAFSGQRLGGRGNLRGRNSNIQISSDKQDREAELQANTFSPLSTEEIMQIPLRDILNTNTDNKGQNQETNDNTSSITEQEIFDDCEDGEE